MFAELLATYCVLQRWKRNPFATKRQIGLWSSWMTDEPINHRPLSRQEVLRQKAFLRKHAPTSHYKLFPDSNAN